MIQGMPKRNKFNVAARENRTWDGHTYSSKAEMLYAKSLYLLREAGEIVEIVEQPKFWLGVRENVYVADFLVVRADGRSEVIEVKGKETPKWLHNKKLWARYGRLPLAVVVKSGKQFSLAEVVEGGSAGGSQRP